MPTPYLSRRRFLAATGATALGLLMRGETAVAGDQEDIEIGAQRLGMTPYEVLIVASMIELGVDVNDDNTVDRYVNPSAASIYDPASANYIPGARVITARIWLVVRGTTIEVGSISRLN